MMALITYLIIGLVWTYIIDRISYQSLQAPLMNPEEILIHIITWPIGLIIFTVTLIKELFSKKD